MNIHRRWQHREICKIKGEAQGDAGQQETCRVLVGGNDDINVMLYHVVSKCFCSDTCDSYDNSMFWEIID